jgi:arylsulfatase A-like enzyme
LGVVAVGLSLGLWLTPAAAVSKPSISKPNIIVILADDLGYGDTNVYGSKIVRTPNIDALAASGVRFTDGHVTHPVCSPSRAGLLTGRYQERFGWEFNPKGRDKRAGASLDEIMLPQAMKAAGYATGMIGKWHLGQSGSYYPTARGFDSFFGMSGGGSDYIIDPKPGDEFESKGSDDELDDVAGAQPARVELAQLKQQLEAARAKAPISRNGVVVNETAYLTEAFTSEGLNFIDAHRHQPFFLYLAYNAPHKPLQATKKYYDRFPDIASKPRRIRAAMISAMDDGIGVIEARLKADGLDRNTLVFFLSDNGCPDLDGACSNGPLVGFKRWHFEGGIRIPFIASWPGHIPAGQVDNRTVSSLDIFPTAVAAARGKLPPDRPYDGVDLMPYLTGRNSGSPNPLLYWRAGPTFAIRDGNWKMIMANLGPPGAAVSDNLKAGKADPTSQPPYPAMFGQHIMLYDLTLGPVETDNLATQQLGTISRLKGELSEWNKVLVPPVWVSRTQHYVNYDGVMLHLYD